jgi:GAF domain-containing protein
MGEVLPAITKLTGYDCGGLYLVDSATGDLNLVFHHGLPEGFVKTASHYSRGTPQFELAMRGEPMHIRYDVLKSIEPEEHNREGLRAVTLLPIRHRGEVVAQLNLASHTMDEIPRSSQVGVEVVAAQLGPALGRILAESRLRGQLGVIRGVTPRLFSAGSVEEVYNVVIEAMEKELGVLASSVAVLEGDSLRFARIASRYVDVVAQGFSLPLMGRGVVPRAAREKRTVLVEDIRSDCDYVAPESIGPGVPEMRSELAVPIIVKKRVVAVLNQEAVVSKAFTDVDCLVLEMLAGQVALAIEKLTTTSETTKFT